MSCLENLPKYKFKYFEEREDFQEIIDEINLHLDNICDHLGAQVKIKLVLNTFVKGELQVIGLSMTILKPIDKDDENYYNLIMFLMFMFYANTYLDNLGDDYVISLDIMKLLDNHNLENISLKLQRYGSFDIFLRNFNALNTIKTRAEKLKETIKEKANNREKYPEVEELLLKQLRSGKLDTEEISAAMSVYGLSDFKEIENIFYYCAHEQMRTIKVNSYKIKDGFKDQIGFSQIKLMLGFLL